MQEFAVEVKRLQHLKYTVLNEQLPEVVELTPHNTMNNVPSEITETQTQMVKEYLLHVLQFGTPEERIKILKGVTSKFILTDRQLLLS